MLKLVTCLLPLINGNLRVGRNVYIDREARLDFRSERNRNLRGSLSIGNGVTLCKGVLISLYGGEIVISSDVYIGPYTVLYGHGGIFIGNNVLIANHSTLVSSSHNYIDKSCLISRQGESHREIVIGDDVWIGSGVRILSGVVIGQGAVLGANSLVNKDIDSYSVSFGTPAMHVKFRE